MKKSKRKKLIAQLDKYCAMAIKERDEHVCQYCGKVVQKQNCHWAHIIPGRGHFLRWHLLNSCVLCFHHHQEWHAGRITKDEWFREKFPARYRYLHGYQLGQQGKFLPRCNIVWKFTDADLEEKLERIKTKLEELKSEQET